jgi:hypothetical protein
MRLEPVQKGVAGELQAESESRFFADYLQKTREFADFHRRRFRTHSSPPGALSASRCELEGVVSAFAVIRPCCG